MPQKFHQKQGKRPKFFRRYAPEPYKSCKKAQNFPALRAGRPTTRFPHTYYICLYSPVFQPGPFMGWDALVIHPPASLHKQEFLPHAVPRARAALLCGAPSHMLVTPSRPCPQGC